MAKKITKVTIQIQVIKDELGAVDVQESADIISHVKGDKI